MPTDPESAKKLLELTVFFALLGYARIKAALKMLVKLTLISAQQMPAKGIPLLHA